MQEELNIANDPSTVVQPRKKTMFAAALAANRANAKKCTGPKSCESKFRASLKVPMHHLYSHNPIIKTEDDDVFEGLSKPYEHLEYQKPSFARQEAHEIRLALFFRRILDRLQSIRDKKSETKPISLETA